MIRKKFNNMFRYVSVLGVVILVVSCEQEITTDIPKGGNLICVNGIFSPDSVIKINLTQTNGINNNNNLAYINNANVDVLENGKFLCRLSNDSNGNYVANNIKPVQENKYKASVSLKGEEKVASTVFIEKKPEITDVVAKTESSENKRKIFCN